jgi:hypothetical protein
MPFSLEEHDKCVAAAVLPEDIRDIVVLIFLEIVMRLTRRRAEGTGFEAVSLEDLHLAFYRAVNELVRRAH